MGLKSNFTIEDIVKRQYQKAKDATDTTLLHFKPLIVEKAKNEHAYNNQTGQLTDTTYGVYKQKLSVLSIVAPAQSPKGYYYSNAVAFHYNENNLKNAAEFYRKDIQDYFKKEVSK